MTELSIEGGQALIGGEILEASLRISANRIAGIHSGGAQASASLDARGLLVLPGIVDLHGDAFERQLMPRAGVDFPIDIALLESDRQAIANGITTVYHATTWSWEPGLRSGDNARNLLEAIEALRPRLSADTRFHLRHETYNLAAEADILGWLRDGRVDLFAFNDHLGSSVDKITNPKSQTRTRMIERSGLSSEQFDRLVARILAQGPEVPASVARLAAAARATGVKMLSHDDRSPDMRRAFRALGVAIAEFPVTEETAQAAAAAGDFIVFGAPNVVRGGSHVGWVNASDMIAKGLCSVLASDYYYPAQLLAAFRLAADGVLPLPRAWQLVSTAPAKATGLIDRGTLSQGYRADLLLVDAEISLRPRVIAVVAGGRLVHLTDPGRLKRVLPAPASAAVAS